MNRSGTCFAVATLAASVAAPAAQPPAGDSAGYPSRPIRMLVGSPPGGTTDILARLVQPRVAEALGQQVVIDNRAGAAGVVAAEITARSAPDGYTLFVAYHSHSTNATLHPKLPYRTVEDFQAITQGIAVGLMLVVHPSLPAHTVQELVAYGRANPGRLAFGSAGNGSGGHLAGEMFRMMTGTPAQHVPYRGTGPALTDLVGGQIPMSFTGIVPVQPFVRSGRLRALGVTTAKRVPVMRDIPTVAESGVPGFEASGWYGFLAPAGLSQPILVRLHGELVKALRAGEVRERLEADGSEVVASSPAEFGRFLRADVEKWARVVKATGAKLD